MYTACVPYEYLVVPMSADSSECIPTTCVAILWDVAFKHQDTYYFEMVQATTPCHFFVAERILTFWSCTQALQLPLQLGAPMPGSLLRWMSTMTSLKDAELWNEAPWTYFQTVGLRHRLRNIIHKEFSQTYTHHCQSCKQNTHTDLNLSFPIRLAVLMILRGKEAKLVTMIGLVCSSWVFMNRHTSQRSILVPQGDVDHKHTAEANMMTSRIISRLLRRRHTCYCILSRTRYMFS